MAYRHITLFCIGLLASFAGFSRDWFPGEIVLKNNNVVTGSVSYEPGSDDLFLRVGNSKEIMVLPAFRIESFYFWDPEIANDRKFVTLRESTGPMTRYVFYEVVENGEISLLRKKRDTWYPNRDGLIDYDYFIKHNEDLITLKTFKKKIFPDLIMASESLKQFADENRINPGDAEHVQWFVKVYNEERSAMANSR